MDSIDKILYPWWMLDTKKSRWITMILLLFLSLILNMFISIVSLSISDLIALEQGLFVIVSMFLMVFQYVSYGSLARKEVQYHIDIVNNKKDKILEILGNIQKDVFIEFVEILRNEVNKFNNIESKIGLSIVYFIFGFIGFLLVLVDLLVFPSNISKTGILNYLIISQFIIIFYSAIYVFCTYNQRANILSKLKKDAIVKLIREYNEEKQNNKVMESLN
jgi:hypothetical protein